MNRTQPLKNQNVNQRESQVLTDGVRTAGNTLHKKTPSNIVLIGQTKNRTFYETSTKLNRSTLTRPGTIQSNFIIFKDKRS
jgi:hypothetical protein